MEIQTQNLFSISLNTNQLASNFGTIDHLLKHMQQQLDHLNQKQSQLQHQMTHNNSAISRLDKKNLEQEGIIKNHAKIMAQFDLEIEIESEKHFDNSCESSIEKENSSQEQKQKQLDQKDRVRESQDTSKDENKVSSKPKTAKAGFQRLMSSFKDRLVILQKDSEEKQKVINELQPIIQKFRPGFKRRQEVVRKSSSKKNLNEQIARPSINVNCQDVGEFQANSLGKVNSEFKDSEGCISFDFIRGEDLSKEILYLRDGMVEKIKVIEAQYKESQHKAQNVQKTVDLLQRSLQMLKYDFQRTSTSWNNQRTASSTKQDRHRKNDYLGETRITTQQQYEQKLVSVYQEMDSIRKDYLDMQSKLSWSKEEDGSFSQNALQVPLEVTGKQKSAKLIHALKTQGNSQKKQMAMVKRELTRLRGEFEDFAFGVNTSSGDVKTVVIKPNENKEDWKILSTKIYKLKMELHSGMREMQGKIATNNDMVVLLNSLETGIEECRLLLKRKVDFNDYEKGLKRVETKLNNFIMQINEKEHKEQDADASMAKQPWCCLSCGDQLKTYTAKINKSPPKERLLGKKVNPEHHMVRRNDNGKLPSVLK